MPQEYVALAATGIGIVGSLGGVFIGQQMSRTWQREQWVLDRRVEEFRELLDAIANGFRASLKMYAGAVLDPDMQREVLEAHSTAMRVIRSRIFVIDEVIKFNVEVRWGIAVQEHQHSLDVEALAAVFNELRVQIVNAARASLSVRPRPWFKRLFGRH